MSLTALAPILVASLLGSLHCAGMCGGLVAAYSGGTASGQRLPHLAYHLARMIAYTSLGALAGGLGGALNLAGTAVGLGRLATVIAGSAMVLWGLGTLFRHRLQRASAASGLISLRRSGAAPSLGWAGRLLCKLGGWPPAGRATALGLLSALLPCGWLYAFVLGAAATGSAWAGALVLLTFWSGTVPILLGLGMGLQRVLGPLRAHWPQVTAVGLILAGSFTALQRVRIPEDALARLQAADVVHTSDQSPPTKSIHGPAAAGDAETCPLHAPIGTSRAKGSD